MSLPTVLMVAVLDAEIRALLAHVPQHELVIDKESGLAAEMGTFEGSGRNWRILLQQVGRNNVDAATMTQAAVNTFAPDYVIFVGVAGGIKDVAVGDVVVGEKVYLYESGKAEEKLKSRPELTRPDQLLHQVALAVVRRRTWQARVREVQHSVPGFDTPKAVSGPIAAGEKVVASSASVAYETIKRSYGDALCVEMEGYGVLRAIQASRRPGLVIRGISDLVDGKSESDAAGSQELASATAAALAFEVVHQLDTATTNLASPTMSVPTKPVVSDRVETPLVVDSSGTMALVDKAFVRATRVERDAHRILLSCQADDSESREVLNALVTQRARSLGGGRVAFAVQNQASWVTIAGGTQRLGADGETEWNLELNLQTPSSTHFSEVATRELSADDIAQLRGRLLLLNEQPKDSRIPDGMLRGALIRAPMGDEMKPLEGSPVPALVGGREITRPLLEELRLILVWLLWAYRVVETVEELKLENRPGDESLHILMKGKRAQRYANVQPAEIEIEGKLELS